MGEADNDRLFCASGTLLNHRFRVLDEKGEGTFSNVYSCVDVTTHGRFVIKASRRKRCYMEAAEEEVKTMKLLNSLDPDHRYFVRYFGSFVHKSHICLVFEPLGPSLFSALQSHDFRPFSVNAVRSFMWQLTNAVAILHRNQMIHTDLKLENVLLVDRDGYDARSDGLRTSIRLIDFGSSDSGSLWHRHLVTTRHYRAPEILMGLRWGYECDIWSLGCILVELAVGNIDFDAKDPVEHLFLIQSMIGDIPRWMWAETTHADLRQFARDGRIQRDCFPRETQERLARKPTLASILHFDNDIEDLAMWMLNPNPETRPTCEGILQHRFFRRR
jgi:dual-specificity kinase